MKKLPVDTGDGRLFGCEVLLADGAPAFALIGNLSLSSSEQNEHFRTLSLFVERREHYISRYHDFDFEKRGPAVFAKAIGKKPEQIFPITYDLSAVAIGSSDCVHAAIPAEPRKRLSRSEIIKLALE